MSTLAASLKPVRVPTTAALRRDPVAQSFVLLRITFTVAPILFGLDKFANVLTNDWTRYLATQFNDIIPGSAADAMHIVGVVEVIAGLVVAFAPRFGGVRRFLVGGDYGKQRDRRNPQCLTCFRVVQEQVDALARYARQ